MKTKLWIEMASVLSLAVVAQAAELQDQEPTEFPPPAALEVPPAPALETPAPAEEAPSPLLVPDTPAPAAPIQPSEVAREPEARPAPARPARTMVARPLSGSGRIKEQRVNLRSRPILTSEVVAQLNEGDQVDVLEEITVTNPQPGEPASWIKIGLPETNFVWVSSRFVDPATRSVTASRLNLRAGPGENHAVVGRLEQGAPIEELEAQGEWLRIAAPSGSYAFVASFLVDRGVGAEEVAAVVPQPEAVAPAPSVAEPSSTAVEPAGSEAVAPAPSVVELEPVVIELEPATTEEPVAVVEVAVEEENPPLIKRVVVREGVVRRSVSIQAPTEFILENIETRKTVNYLYLPRSSDLVLRNFEGQRIRVSGEELLDERWPLTPVLNIEKLKARP